MVDSDKPVYVWVPNKRMRKLLRDFQVKALEQQEMEREAEDAGISENEQDDIEYARSLQYDEAIFIEDKETVIIHDIRSWYMEKLSVSDVLYKE